MAEIMHRETPPSALHRTPTALRVAFALTAPFHQQSDSADPHCSLKLARVCVSFGAGDGIYVACPLCLPASNIARAHFTWYCSLCRDTAAVPLQIYWLWQAGVPTTEVCSAHDQAQREIT